MLVRRYGGVPELLRERARHYVRTSEAARRTRAPLRRELPDSRAAHVPRPPERAPAALTTAAATSEARAQRSRLRQSSGRCSLELLAYCKRLRYCHQLYTRYCRLSCARGRTHCTDDGYKFCRRRRADPLFLCTAGGPSAERQAPHHPKVRGAARRLRRHDAVPVVGRSEFRGASARAACEFHIECFHIRQRVRIYVLRSHSTCAVRLHFEPVCVLGFRHSSSTEISCIVITNNSIGNSNSAARHVRFSARVRLAAGRGQTPQTACRGGRRARHQCHPNAIHSSSRPAALLSAPVREPAAVASTAPSAARSVLVPAGRLHDHCVRDVSAGIPLTGYPALYCIQFVQIRAQRCLIEYIIALTAARMELPFFVALPESSGALPTWSFSSASSLGGGSSERGSISATTASYVVVDAVESRALRPVPGVASLRVSVELTRVSLFNSDPALCPAAARAPLSDASSVGVTTRAQARVPAWMALLPAKAVALAASRRVLAVAASDATLLLYSVRTGRQLSLPVLLDAPVSHLHVSRDALVAVSAVGTLTVWMLSSSSNPPASAYGTCSQATSESGIAGSEPLGSECGPESGLGFALRTRVKPTSVRTVLHYLKACTAAASTSTASALSSKPQPDAAAGSAAKTRSAGKGGPAGDMHSPTTAVESALQLELTLTDSGIPIIRSRVASRAFVYDLNTECWHLLPSCLHDQSEHIITI